MTLFMGGTMQEYVNLIGGISIGIIIGFFAGLWHTADAYNKQIEKNGELLKFIMAKQDMGAFVTAFPKPDIDKLKMEEESKTRKNISEYNNIILRDSVKYGVTEDEMKRFGFNEEGINA